jgi:hypothetical protein
MAMHDLGYRHWDEDAPYRKFSWLSISRYGTRLAWKSQWLKRIVIFAFMPFFGLLVAVFFYEQASNWPVLYPGLVTAVEVLEARQDEVRPPGYRVNSRQNSAETVIWNDLPANVGDPEKVVQEYIDSHRSMVWRTGFYYFFRFAQGPLMVVLVGMIAPGLISRDNQSRAFLLYFSRPISAFQYLLGKAATVWAFQMAVVTIPALTVYLGGILFSPGPGVILNTWDIPLRIVIASAVLVIPTTAFVLCLSSLVEESRYAGFAWYATWIVGFLTWAILTTNDAVAVESPSGWTSSWEFLSFYHVLGNVEQWVFGLMNQPANVIPSVAILSTLTVVCFLVTMRRITAPIRI